jgi:hypothetical protein
MLANRYKGQAMKLDVYMNVYTYLSQPMNQYICTDIHNLPNLKRINLDAKNVDNHLHYYTPQEMNKLRALQVCLNTVWRLRNNGNTKDCRQLVNKSTGPIVCMLIAHSAIRVTLKHYRLCCGLGF